MSKITNDGLTRSNTGCFIAVPIWQQWTSKSFQLPAPDGSVSENSSEVVVRKHSLRIQPVSDLDESLPAGVDRSDLLRCELESLGPVRSAPGTQHYVLERRPVVGVVYVLTVRPTTPETNPIQSLL